MSHASKSMITVPYAEAAHYPLLRQWWEGHGVAPTPPSWLSPLGLVAFDAPEGTPLAACGLYLTGTAVCWMEGLVSNPAVSKRLAGAGVDRVVGELIMIAKQYGHAVVSTSTERRSAIRHGRRHGLQVVQGFVMMARAF